MDAFTLFFVIYSNVNLAVKIAVKSQDSSW